MEASDSTGGGKPRVIDLSQLPIEELSRLQRQLDAEIQVFQESVADLRMAANKFGRSQSTVESMDGAEPGKIAMIPLSESVYIKAELVNPNNYLVEIGTGYYTEMNREQAKDYFLRKYNFVEGQIRMIQDKVIPEKSQVRTLIAGAVQRKIREMTQNGPSSTHQNG